MAERSHRLNGGEACTRLGQIFEALLIIVGQDGKKAAGIELLERGADVYLSFPLNLRELLARVHSLLQRAKANTTQLEEDS